MTLSTTDTPDDEAARVLIDRQMMKYDGPTPAIVSNVATGGQTVDAQPAIDQTVTLEGVRSAMPRAQVRGAPVMMLGSTSKQMFICPPISAGDDGVLFPMMRALDNWQHGEGNGPPPDMQSPRHSDLSDSVFFPGVLRESGAISNYPTEAITIQDAAASTVLSVKAGEIKATVGAMTFRLDATGLHIDCPVFINGETSIVGLLALLGNFGQEGNQVVAGTVTANAFITAP
ncbi:hypothetical protein D3C85_464640 [compost metagenome]